MMWFTSLPCRTPREPNFILGRIGNIIWKDKEKHQPDPPLLPLQNTTHHLSQIGLLHFLPHDQHKGVTLTMSSMSCAKRLFPFTKKFTTSPHRWKCLTSLTLRRQNSYIESSITFNVILLQLKHPDHHKYQDIHSRPPSSIHCRFIHDGRRIYFYSYYYLDLIFFSVVFLITSECFFHYASFNISIFIIIFTYFLALCYISYYFLICLIQGQTTSKYTMQSTVSNKMVKLLKRAQKYTKDSLRPKSS